MSSWWVTDGSWLANKVSINYASLKKKKKLICLNIISF